MQHDPAIYPMFASVSRSFGVDWAALAGSGVSFGFIKATESRTLIDRNFQDHWQRPTGPTATFGKLSSQCGMIECLLGTAPDDEEKASAAASEVVE